MIILCVFAKQCKELLELQHCHLKYGWYMFAWYEQKDLIRQSHFSSSAFECTSMIKEDDTQWMSM